LANLSKHQSTQKLLISELEMICWAADNVFTELKEDKTLVNGCVMALNNILFSEGGLSFDKERKLSLLKGLWNILRSDNENNVVAALNLSILILSKDTSLVKEYDPSSRKVALEGLALSSNSAIGSFSRDLLFALR
jgi:hypothetical protein